MDGNNPKSETYQKQLFSHINNLKVKHKVRSVLVYFFAYFLRESSV